MIDPELLRILACPACKGEVHLQPDQKGIFCQACKRRYPIREGIPVMLIEEAEVLEDESRAGAPEPPAS